MSDDAPLTMHWFLPTMGDGRHLVGGGRGAATGSAGAIRPASIGYLTQVARAAEQVGFTGALTRVVARRRGGRRVRARRRVPDLG